MTSIDLKDQIRNLIAQHLSQIETMVSDAQSKQSDALYAGFVANREEQRKDALEGEISIWQSKMAVGQTATRSFQEAKIQAAEVMRQRAEHKVKELEQQKSSLGAFLNFLHSELEAMKEKQNTTGNPLLDLFVSMLEAFVEIVEKLADAEEEKKELSQETPGEAGTELSTIIKNAETKVESQKALQQTLHSQSNEKQSDAVKHSQIFQDKLGGLEEKDRSQNHQKEYFVDKIMSIQEKLEKEGKSVPVDKLMQVSTSGDKSKLVIDQSLSSLYQDLTLLLGEENVVVNRRDGDRRQITDRRGDNFQVNNEERSDIAGRRQGDRRAPDSPFFT